jgi:hypothetical protein
MLFLLSISAFSTGYSILAQLEVTVENIHIRIEVPTQPVKSVAPITAVGVTIRELGFMPCLSEKDKAEYARQKEMQTKMRFVLRACAFFTTPL